LCTDGTRRNLMGGEKLRALGSRLHMALRDAIADTSL
jgi:hypothetical protein